MSQEQVTFDQLAWGAIFFGVIDPGRTSYMKIYASDFQRLAVNDPDHLTLDEITGKLIEFLQKWQMRIPRKEEKPLAENLLKAIRNVAPELKTLDGYRLETVEFTSALESAIKKTYGCLQEVRRLGPTGTSKVLGVLNPSLFVMWDARIREDYGVGFYHEGYVEFLRRMHGMARSIVEDARIRLGLPDPAGFLSHKLKIAPPLTLAKFIDEYNWVRSKVTIPPIWHPDMVCKES